MMKLISIPTLLVATCILLTDTFGLQSAAADSSAPEKDVLADAEISLPVDFRGTMTHLGSWFVPEGGASGFHDVYANPEAVEGYRNTGVFPDGSVLVKELRAHIAGTYTTGAGVAHATEAQKQWFVMVKDGTNRFAESPAWGEGWGWALFKPGASAKNLVTDYKADCLGCHVPAKQNDWVYVEGYPTLGKPASPFKSAK